MCISSLRKLYPCIDCQCVSTVDLNAVTTGLHHPVCSLTQSLLTHCPAACATGSRKRRSSSLSAVTLRALAISLEPVSRGR